MNMRSVAAVSIILGCLFQAAARAAGNGEAVAGLYNSMDSALAAGREGEAMGYYESIVAYGKEASAALDTLTARPPLSLKTYNAAVSAWRAIGDRKSATPGLRRLLASETAGTDARAKCIRVLTEWKDKESAPEMARIFSDKAQDENLRAAAAASLRRLDPDAARAAFIAVLGDDSEKMIVHYKAAQYLAGDKDVRARAGLKRHLTGGPAGYEFSRERALLAIESAGDAEAVEDIAGALESDSVPEKVKERALKALSGPRLSGAGGRKALEDLAGRTRNAGLREKARKALEEAR